MSAYLGFTLEMVKHDMMLARRVLVAYGMEADEADRLILGHWSEFTKGYTRNPSLRVVAGARRLLKRSGFVVGSLATVSIDARCMCHEDCRQDQKLAFTCYSSRSRKTPK